MALYSENAEKGIYTVTEQQLVTRLSDEKYEYKYSILPIQTENASSITVKQGENTVDLDTPAVVSKATETPAETYGTLIIEPEQGTGTSYYIVSEGLYYLVNLEGGNITIGEKLTSPPTSDSDLSLTVVNKNSLQKLEIEENGLTLKVIGRTLGDENLTISYGGQEIEVKVTVKNPAIAFRSYGNPENSTTYGNDYSLTSTGETIKVDINNTPSNTEDDVEVADKWKIFFEDTDFLYLIYEDYYPLAAQTTTDTTNLALTTSSNYPYAIYGIDSRDGFLKYLRNYSNYFWTDNGESFVDGGTQYQSWTKLTEAISGLSKMRGKTISVQAAPDIHLWIKSWNAKGNTQLKAQKLRIGYNIALDVVSPPANSYYINVKTDSTYNATSNEANKTGYYDKLYFPYTTYTVNDGTSGNAYGYWLASPDENCLDGVCFVDYQGYIHCNEPCSRDNMSARPVIAIQK